VSQVQVSSAYIDAMASQVSSVVLSDPAGASLEDVSVSADDLGSDGFADGVKVFRSRWMEGDDRMVVEVTTVTALLRSASSTYNRSESDVTADFRSARAVERAF
jgi:hypothetical protein